MLQNTAGNLYVKFSYHLKKKKRTSPGINNSCTNKFEIRKPFHQKLLCSICRLLLHEEFCTARSNNAITYSFIIRAYSTCQFQVRQALKMRFWEALETENSHFEVDGNIIVACSSLLVYLLSCRLLVVKKCGQVQ